MRKAMWWGPSMLGVALLSAGCGANNPLTRLDNVEQRVANLERDLAVMHTWFLVFVGVSVLVWIGLFLWSKNR